MTLKQILEALVFASPKPLLTKEIMAALRAASESMEDDGVREYGKASEEQVLAELEALRKDYADAGRAFRLVEQVNGWTLVTEPMAAPWVRQLYPEAKPTRLSGPALETLAIIAYRQPVTRADIEAVRGVAVDGVMQVLLDRSLVKIAGRAEVPGRPLLYSTTEYFLQHFGLKTVDELPNAGELRRIPLPQPPSPEEKAKKAETPAEETPAPGAEPPEPEAPQPTLESTEEAPASDAAFSEPAAGEPPHDQQPES
jgi:segregation and condensation protein B